MTALQITTYLNSHTFTDCLLAWNNFRQLIPVFCKSVLYKSNCMHSPVKLKREVQPACWRLFQRRGAENRIWREGIEPGLSARIRGSCNHAPAPNETVNLTGAPEEWAEEIKLNLKIHSATSHCEVSFIIHYQGNLKIVVCGLCICLIPRRGV